MQARIKGQGGSDRKVIKDVMHEQGKGKENTWNNVTAGEGKEGLKDIPVGQVL